MNSLVVEGDLSLWAQDFGFHADSIVIGEKVLGEIIAEHFGFDRLPSPSREDCHIGTVRITIELLEGEL